MKNLKNHFKTGWNKVEEIIIITVYVKTYARNRSRNPLLTSRIRGQGHQISLTKALVTLADVL